MKSKCRNSKKWMKSLVRSLVLGMVFMPVSLTFAQKAKSSVPTELPYKADVIVDGKLLDWNDTLRYRYEKQHLQYEVAYDEDHLYVAMRVKDMAAQMQALHQGFNLGVNLEGKKKEGARLIFPVPDRESLRGLMSKDEEERPKDARLLLLKAVRGIYVTGLADVVDGLISLENDYGIRTAIAIDSADAICYEAVIPFARLGLDPAKVGQLALNVKINGVIMRTVGGGMPMGSRYYGGYGYPYGYYGNQPARKEAQQEPGLWFVLPLAKP